MKFTFLNFSGSLKVWLLGFFFCSQITLALYAQTTQIAYVAERQGNRVTQVDLATGAKTTIATINNADGIIKEPGGTLLVTSWSGVSSSLYRVDPGTGAVSVVATGFGGSLQGLRLDGLGNVYVVNEGGPTIEKVDLATGAVTNVVSGLNRPIDLVFDTPNSILFSELNFGTIVRLDLVSGLQTTVVTGLNQPTGIYQKSDGNLYVAEFLRISEVDPVLNTRTTIANNHSHSLFESPAGDLYSVFQGTFGAGEIQRVDPGGVLVTVASGMDQPIFGIYDEVILPPGVSSAVPTMSQWGLIILGLIVLCVGVVALFKMQNNRRAKVA